MAQAYLDMLLNRQDFEGFEKFEKEWQELQQDIEDVFNSQNSSPTSDCFPTLPALQWRENDTNSTLQDVGTHQELPTDEQMTYVSLERNPPIETACDYLDLGDLLQVPFQRYTDQKNEKLEARMTTCTNTQSQETKSATTHTHMLAAEFEELRNSKTKIQQELMKMDSMIKRLEEFVCGKRKKFLTL